MVQGQRGYRQARIQYGMRMLISKEKYAHARGVLMSNVEKSVRVTLTRKGREARMEGAPPRRNREHGTREMPAPPRVAVSGVRPGGSTLCGVG